MRTAATYPILALPALASSAIEIAQTIHQRGVCVLEDFFSDAQLAAIRAEYEQTLARKAEQQSPYWTYVESSNQHLVAAVDDIEPDHPALGCGQMLLPNLGFPVTGAIQQVIESPFLRELAQHYYADQGYLYPVRVQFIKTFPFEKGASNQIPFVPHADRQRFLKFFIYLHEMTTDKGPLRVLPVQGADYESIEIGRQHQFSEGKHWTALNTLVDADEDSFVDIVPRKNSLVIFDSNLPHMAKHNSSAEDRNVVIIELQSSDEYLKHGKPLWLQQMQDKS